VNVIIGIGFGTLATVQARTFESNVDSVIRRLGTVEASIRGVSWSPQWGSEPAAWIAASFPSFDAYIEARARILAIGSAYGQDAVAFTVGSVDVAECPSAAQRAREYRDLL